MRLDLSLSAEGLGTDLSGLTLRDDSHTDPMLYGASLRSPSAWRT